MKQIITTCQSIHHQLKRNTKEQGKGYKGKQGQINSRCNGCRPNDCLSNRSGLLARSREESERLIDELCKTLTIADKPRTYRRLARKQYLNVAKKKHKTTRELHKAIGQQLRYLKRNLKSIHGLLDKATGMSFPLKSRDQKIFG